MKIENKSVFGRFSFESLFLVKLMAGFFIYWLYTYYYPLRADADVYKYFDDGRVLFELSKQDFGAYLNAIFNSELPEFTKPHFQNWFRPGSYNVVNTNLTMIKIHSVLFYVSLGSYHIHSLIFSFLAFLGSVFLYNSITKMFKGISPKLVFLSFCVPSFLLWSSGPLKETLVVFTLFFAIGFLIRLKNQKSTLNILGLFLFTWFTFYAKPYFCVGLLGLIPFFLFPSKKNWLKYAMALALVMVVLILGNTILPKLDVISWIANKQRDFLNFSHSIDAGSIVYLPHMDKSIVGFLSVLPVALFNLIFRPFLWESLNPLYLFSALENLVIIGSVVISVFWRKKHLQKPKQDLVWFLFILALMQYAVIGLTTPVIGAFLRYKAPVLPLIVIACILLINHDKIKRYAPKKFR